MWAFPGGKHYCLFQRSSVKNQFYKILTIRVLGSWDLRYSLLCWDPFTTSSWMASRMLCILLNQIVFGGKHRYNTGLRTFTVFMSAYLKLGFYWLSKIRFLLPPSKFWEFFEYIFINCYLGQKVYNFNTYGYKLPLYISWKLVKSY